MGALELAVVSEMLREQFRLHCAAEKIPCLLLSLVLAPHYCVHLILCRKRPSTTRVSRNLAMDWTGPNAAVAAGNALLDRRIGENVNDIAKHVFQLAQSLRSVDGTDTGLTGFDMEFAVRTAPTRKSGLLADLRTPSACHLRISNHIALLKQIISSSRNGAKTQTGKRPFMPPSEGKTAQRTAM